MQSILFFFIKNSYENFFFPTHIKHNSSQIIIIIITIIYTIDH